MTNALKRNVKNSSNEKEKFKDIYRKSVWKCSNSFFLCGDLSCNSSKTFKKFRWPKKIVKLRKWQKNQKIWKQSKKFKLQALFKTLLIFAI